MAIFANASYSDPLRALTIKALEKRQADLAAAQAKEELPTSMPSPWQGLAHVAGSIGDAMQLSRVENAAAARRGELAKLISGVGAEGPNPQQLAGIMSADPDLGTKYLEMAAHAREAAATRAAEMERLKLTETGATTRQGTQIGSTEKLAAERTAAEQAAAAKLAENQSLLEQQKAEERRQAEADQAARTAAENEKNRQAEAERTQPNIVRLKAAFSAGKLSKEEFDQAMKLELAPKPSEQKVIFDQGDEYLKSASSISQLKRAQEYLNQGVDYGLLSGARTALGKMGVSADIPGAGKIDPDLANRTNEFNNIMNFEAVKSMAGTLRGATTDFELREFIKLLNDPTATPEAKKRRLQEIINNEEAFHNERAKRITDAGRSLPTKPAAVDAGAGAPAPKRPDGRDDASLLEEARQAIASGKSPEAVKRRLQEMGVKGSL